MGKDDPRDVFLFEPVGAHVDGTVITSAVELTASAPAAATKIMIQAQAQNVRFTLDGTTPSATVGFTLVAGDPPIILQLGNDVEITVIEEAATADLQYQWGKG